MAEYLDREAFKKSIDERYCKQCKAKGEDHNECLCCACGINGMFEEVDCFQSVDVAPVVHGWWEHVDSSYWRWTSSGAVSISRTTYRCGRCGRGTVVKTNYCSNCGAKMDKK